MSTPTPTVAPTPTHTSTPTPTPVFTPTPTPIATPTPVSIPSAIIRFSSLPEVFKAYANKILHIKTIEVFNSLKLKWSDVKESALQDKSKYQRAKLVKTQNSSKVYYLTESELKRHIPTAEIFNSYNNKWEDIITITDTELNSFPDNNLIKLEDDLKVYKLEGVIKQWIQTAEAFNRLKLDWSKIAPINQTEFDYYKEGEVVK
jgi:hypothetical protein